MLSIHSNSQDFTFSKTLTRSKYSKIIPNYTNKSKPVNVLTNINTQYKIIAHDTFC